MLLITEQSFDWVKPIIEEGTEGRPKSYFIEGIMLQAETVNRNGRKYPTKILMKECERYSKDLIREKRSFGELNHPSSPTVNLDRVSHMITELRQSHYLHVMFCKGLRFAALRFLCLHICVSDN